MSHHGRYTIKIGNSLAVQWLGLHAFTAEGLGSIPGLGTKTPQAMQRRQNRKIKMDCYLLRRSG